MERSETRSGDRASVEPPAIPSATARALRSRDSVIDVWRGLALVGMAWIHLLGHGLVLPGLLDDVVREHLRFSAGAFVFLAGLAVATVFGPALVAGGAAGRRARRYLWRRALLLLVLDRLLGVGRALLDSARAGAPFGEGGEGSIVALLLFREAGVTGGLLLLYALLLGMTPGLMAIRRRAGWGAVAVLSVAVYAAGMVFRSALVSTGWCFPFSFWQPLFVGGFLAVPAWRWLRGGGTTRLAGWALVASAIYAAFLVARHGPFGVMDPLEWDFTKVPLLPAELLRYVVTMQVVFAWAALVLVSRPWRWSGLTAMDLLGRNSLIVYVAHLFVELPLVELIWSVGPTPAGTAALLLFDAAALVAVAAAVEWLDRRAAEAIAVTRRPLWLRVPRGAMVGSAAVAVSAALVFVSAAKRAPRETQVAITDEAPDAIMTVDVLETISVEDLYTTPAEEPAVDAFEDETREPMDV